MDQLDRPLAVAKGSHARLHGYRQGGTGLDGVQPVEVAQAYHLGDVVEVVDLAIGAQRPVRLVLDARGDLGTVLGIPGVRALDDAAWAAGMVIDLLAFARLDALKDRLAGDLGSAIKPPPAKVSRGQAPGLVQDVDQHSRAVAVEAALGLGDVVTLQGVGQLALPLPEEVGVGDLGRRGALCVEHHELEPFATHHGAEAATPRVPRRPPV